MCLFLFVPIIAGYDMAINHELTVTHCGKSTGIYFIRVNVSIESAALLLMQAAQTAASNIPFDFQASAFFFIAQIFELCNYELKKYGVQLKAEYGHLEMESLPFQWDKKSCWESDPILTHTQIAKQYFEETQIHGVGNKLLIMYCPFAYKNDIVRQTVRLPVGDCGHVIGVMFSDLETLKYIIKEELMAMVGRGKYHEYDVIMPHYNEGVCRYVRQCIMNVGNVIGQYINDFRYLKEPFGADYYLPMPRGLDSHAIFDDASIAGSFRGGTRQYPTEDYAGMTSECHLGTANN